MACASMHIKRWHIRIVTITLVVLSYIPHGAMITAKGKEPDKTPAFPRWPERFYAPLSIFKDGQKMMVDLYYDYERGANLNLIRSDDGAGPLFNLEWNNGTSYFYTPATRTCEVIEFGVGILPPTWLDNANFTGIDEVGGHRCFRWEKGDSDFPGKPFITYWDDIHTRIPMQYQFGSGTTVEILDFFPFEDVPDELWQIPSYCFVEALRDSTIARS